MKNYTKGMKDNIDNCRILYVRDTEMNNVSERLVVMCNGGVVKFSKCKDYPFSNILHQRRIEKFAQSNYSCRRCGETSAVVHHKDFDTFDHSIENLDCLCDSCHIKLHKIEKIKNRFKEWRNERGLDR